jgi:ABC-2 type transport system permease protein
MRSLTADRTLDVSGTSRAPLTRLVGVELRKLVDTRSGRWLLGVIVLLTALVVAGFWLVADDADRTFLNFSSVTVLPQSVLLPVLGILLVTSEWSQRTALITFTLVPHRERVVAAKTVAAVIFGLAAVAVALAVGALATAVGGSAAAWDGVGVADVGNLLVLQLLAVLQGVAFGLLILSPAGAIAAFFVLPVVMNVLVSIWDTVRDVQPWIDMAYAQEPLFEGTGLTGEQWAHVGTTTLLWVALPFAVGVWRVLRAEVK